MKPPLLVVDGDSFTHRAYHALPKAAFRRKDGGPANALIGFSGMLLRLWNAERPRAVLVAWDTLTVPTYRHVEFETYQSGREFEPELVEQLDLLPAFLETWGIACVKSTRVRGGRLPRVGGDRGGSGGREHPRRDLGPRRVPARRRADDHPPAGSRQPTRTDRPG